MLSVHYSGETLYKSRFILNANRLKEEPVVASFRTVEFDTHARVDGENIFFGKIDDSNQERMKRLAKGLLNWSSEEDILWAAIQWDGPQSGVVICPDGRSAFRPVHATFSGGVNSIQVVSRHNCTELSFEGIGVDGIGRQQVEVDWSVDRSGINSAVDRLVTDHLDLIIAGKVQSVLDGRIARQP